MDVKPKGRKPINDKAFETIRKGGKSVTLKKKDWKLATPPGAYILRKYLQMEYKVQTLADDSGWLIARV